MSLDSTSQQSDEGYFRRSGPASGQGAVAQACRTSGYGCGSQSVRVIPSSSALLRHARHHPSSLRRLCPRSPGPRGHPLDHGPPRFTWPATTQPWPGCWTQAPHWQPPQAGAQLRRHNDLPPGPARTQGLAHPGRSRQPAALHSSARGIRRDQQAVIAGLALPYRSGALEGKNCQTRLVSRATTPITGSCGESDGGSLTDTPSRAVVLCGGGALRLAR